MLYPFRSNWFESSVGSVHYLDEGEGRPLFLMHGNPDWSFLFRQMIPLLSKPVRCVVPDLPGFGLSAHPADYGYMPADHSAILGELVEHLDLRDMVVMGADWGGPISIDMASRRPERVGGLVYGNTWFWPTDNPASLRMSRMLSTRPMQWLILEQSVLGRFGMKSMMRAPASKAELSEAGHFFQHDAPARHHRLLLDVLRPGGNQRPHYYDLCMLGDDHDHRPDMARHWQYGIGSLQTVVRSDSMGVGRTDHLGRHRWPLLETLLIFLVDPR